ncbi:hypothetical protein L9F63_019904, partial [Diploptera punctata]
TQNSFPDYGFFKIFITPLTIPKTRKKFKILKVVTAYFQFIIIVFATMSAAMQKYESNN